MTMQAKARGSAPTAVALALLGLFALAGCATPPTGAPTAEDIRGLKPSGSVTMTQMFVSGSGVGTGTLTVNGRSYPFTLVGELVGLGAVAMLDASGEVYNLHNVSDFAGAYFQGTRRLAVSGSGTGDLWLKNNHGVMMRLTAKQAGLTLTTGRAQIFIQLGN